jgi:hypothetical protein
VTPKAAIGAADGILQAARGVLASSNFLVAEAGIVGARVALNVARETTSPCCCDLVTILGGEYDHEPP